MVAWGRRPVVSRYRDRAHAGAVLAELVAERLGPRPAAEATYVLALPRGGLPVGAPIAARLGAPLCPLVVRKLGAPGRPELAVGAVATVGGRVETVRNEQVIAAIGLSEQRFAEIRGREAAGLAERLTRFGGPPELTGATVVLVDDGLATGATASAALSVVSAGGPRFVLLAVPVASAAALAGVGAHADAVVCPLVPKSFAAVGQVYDDFTQVSDAEASRLLGR